MLICIDAGHGRNTAGKRCLKRIDPGETREWTLNSRIADKLQTLLAGYDCQTMRADDVTGDRDVPLADRCEAANAVRADVYLSIHHNAGINGGSGGGIVVYICPDHQKQSEVVQEAAYRHLIAQTGLKGNRASPMAQSNLYVLRNTTMPAVLCECGFMDSTHDTPIILTEEFADQAARGLRDALEEVYGLKPSGGAEEPGAQTTYTNWNGVHDFGVPVGAFRVELIDAPKGECGDNYCNAGYFGNYTEQGEPFTLPAGHLAADLTAKSQWVRHYIQERGRIEGEKAVFDSYTWSYLNPLYQKTVSVLLVRDGAASIQEVQELPQCDYAVAGIPVLRGGQKATTAQAMAQGWDKSSLRATHHIFVGLNGDGRIHVLGMETKGVNLLDSGEAAELLAARGYTDVIKLDGGGSYVIRSDAVRATTGGDRRICSIIRLGSTAWGGVEKPEEPEDPGYEQWKAYMERYRAELVGQAAAMPELLEEAVSMGLTDGSRPRDLMTREEGAVMARAAAMRAQDVKE